MMRDADSHRAVRSASRATPIESSASVLISSLHKVKNKETQTHLISTLASKLAAHFNGIRLLNNLILYYCERQNFVKNNYEYLSYQNYHFLFENCFKMLGKTFFSIFLI